MEAIAFHSRSSFWKIMEVEHAKLIAQVNWTRAEGKLTLETNENLGVWEPMSGETRRRNSELVLPTGYY